MESLKNNRSFKSISQRRLAALAGISYKTLQLIESGRHDPKVSTLEALSRALGLPPGLLHRRLESAFAASEDSIAAISERIVQGGEDSWKTWLFNFVDAYRSRQDARLIAAPPAEYLSPRLKALLASTTEALCAETGMSPPSWCDSVPLINEPWFVSGVENLKAAALVESSAFFRKRNIFVLGDFLLRA